MLLISIRATKEGKLYDIASLEIINRVDHPINGYANYTTKFFDEDDNIIKESEVTNHKRNKGCYALIQDALNDQPTVDEIVKHEARQISSRLIELGEIG